jgi:hypothetical protein
MKDMVEADQIGCTYMEKSKGNCSFENRLTGRGIPVCVWDYVNNKRDLRKICS